MNNVKKLIQVLGNDKELFAILRGAIACGLAFITIAVTAGIYYL